MKNKVSTLKYLFGNLLLAIKEFYCCIFNSSLTTYFIFNIPYTTTQTKKCVFLHPSMYVKRITVWLFKEIVFISLVQIPWNNQQQCERKCIKHTIITWNYKMFGYIYKMGFSWPQRQTWMKKSRSERIPMATMPSTVSTLPGCKVTPTPSCDINHCKYLNF